MMINRNPPRPFVFLITNSLTLAGQTVVSLSPVATTWTPSPNPSASPSLYRIYCFMGSQLSC